MPTRLVLSALISAALVVWVGPTAQATTTPQVIASIAVGATPFGIDVTPDGSRVYVSNSTGASVSVIATGTNSVVSTITSNVGTTPVGIAIDSSGTYAYVANYGAGTLTRINIANGSTTSQNLSATVNGVCANVLNIALSASGTTVYAACQDQNRVISAPIAGGVGSGTVLSSVSLTSPTDVALSTDSSTLVSSLSQSNQAFVQDATGQAYISVPADPYAVAVSPTTGLAYFASRSSGNVTVLNPSTRSIVGSTITIGGSLSDIAITPDGASALVSAVDRDLVSIINLRTGLVTHTVTVGDGPQSLTISADGRFAYTANRYDNTVSVIALPEVPASGSSVPTAPLQQFARTENETCEHQPANLVDFPALTNQVDLQWGMSWARWPNGGTGGFICTRQPFYTTRGTWAVI